MGAENPVSALRPAGGGDDAGGRHTVEKIGGTSMADMSAVVDNIVRHGREEDDYYNRVLVVSAFAGVTDLLLEGKHDGARGVFAHYASGESDWAWGDSLTDVCRYLREVSANALAGDPILVREADNFVRDRIEAVRDSLVDIQRLCSFGQLRIDSHLSTVREMLAAIGEAHSAFTLSLRLRREGIAAQFIDLTGWRDPEPRSLSERIDLGLGDVDLSRVLPVVTGYARCEEGMVSRFGRGYSELTFACVASRTRAREAVIHKEYHLSSADPKIVGVERVKPIGASNYDVADQLANMGMEAIHPGAAKYLRQANIPLRIKNTFEPGHGGTCITQDYSSSRPAVEIITSRRGVHALEFFEQDMVGVHGYDERILQVLREHDVPIVSKDVNANTITHYVVGSIKRIGKVVRRLSEEYEGAEISTRKVGVIAPVGSNLNVDGLLVRCVGTLYENGIDILSLHQSLRWVEMQIMVEEDCLDDAVRLLHEALIERGAQDASALSAA